MSRITVELVVEQDLDPDQPHRGVNRTLVTAELNADGTVAWREALEAEGLDPDAF